MTDSRPWTIAPRGADILKRGGHDDQDDDGMLILELARLGPGMTQDELQQCFVAVRMEYGEDALAAIKAGYVKFEERK